MADETNKTQEPKPADPKGADAAMAAVADDTELVTVRKHGETLEVHPSCVAAHIAAGWEL